MRSALYINNYNLAHALFLLFFDGKIFVTVDNKAGIFTKHICQPRGPGGTLLIKIKFWKEFKISHSSLLLLNNVSNGLILFSFCV